MVVLELSPRVRRIEILWVNIGLPHRLMRKPEPG
jgi:hypothetical protein